MACPFCMFATFGIVNKLLPITKEKSCALLVSLAPSTVPLSLPLVKTILIIIFNAYFYRFPFKFGGKDLCQADSKSFTTQWTLLLPASDVLQPRWSISRTLSCFCCIFSFLLLSLNFSTFHLLCCFFLIYRKFEATLMTCLLYDPYLKVLDLLFMCNCLFFLVI